MGSTSLACRSTALAARRALGRECPTSPRDFARAHAWEPQCTFRAHLYDPLQAGLEDSSRAFDGKRAEWVAKRHKPFQPFLEVRNLLSQGAFRLAEKRQALRSREDAEIGNPASQGVVGHGRSFLRDRREKPPANLA